MAITGPQLNLEKIAPVGNQKVVGLLLEEIVRRSRRLAQPASRNGSLLGSKRDRRITSAAARRAFSVIHDSAYFFLILLASSMLTMAFLIASP
jgi:hypothetical protein